MFRQVANSIVFRFFSQNFLSLYFNNFLSRTRELLFHYGRLRTTDWLAVGGHVYDEHTTRGPQSQSASEDSYLEDLSDVASDASDEPYSDDDVLNVEQAAGAGLPDMDGLFN